uniref:LRIM1/APL1C-like dimerization domain-containing protein n=1 Tax=Anopheles culicifacies TaxID=139723 RepID=A0A182LSG9_9DIPT
MQSLERLYLSNNRLVQLKLNNNPIRSLKVLDIRHNYLLYVESNHKQFDTLEELYLDHNSIVTLKLSTNNKLRSLTLSNNDWDCKNLERLFEKVNRSVVGDSDRSCKQDYQLEHDLCCKVSAKPYLDRLVQYNVFASIVAKNQRAEGRCSANDTITRLQHLNSFVITKKELLQGTSQREAEINQLQNEIAQIEQNKSRFDQLHNDLRTEIDHNLRRYRVTKDGLVHPKANLRKLFKHLKSRRTFKEEETQSRILDAQRKMQDVETMIQANADLQNKLERKKANLTELKRNIKQRENAVKRLEAKYNNNPETRRITK